MTAIRVLSMASVVFLTFAVALATRVPSVLAQPEVTESNVENGDVLDAAPETFHLCFSEPVNNQDLADFVPEEEGQLPWQFNVSLPDGQGLGLRIVFEADGDCVDVFPGLPEEEVEGVWTFDWMVRSQETNEEVSDAIRFRVGPGDPPVTETPDESDGGSDTTLIVLIAAGVGVAVALGVGGALFAVGRRRGRSSTE